MSYSVGRQFETVSRGRHEYIKLAWRGLLVACQILPSFQTSGLNNILFIKLRTNYRNKWPRISNINFGV